VDNPFMAGAAAYPAWLAVQCSFFDQDPARKIGAGSTALHLCGARLTRAFSLVARTAAWRMGARQISWP